MPKKTAITKLTLLALGRIPTPIKTATQIGWAIFRVRIMLGSLHA